LETVNSPFQLASPNVLREGGTKKIIENSFILIIKIGFGTTIFCSQRPIKKNQFHSLLNFLFLRKALTLYAYSSEIDIWNHGETSISDYTYRSAQIKYSYAGVNLGIHKVLFNEKIYNLILGANLHTEFLVHENEYNHKDSSSSVYRGNGYNFQTQTKYSFTYLTTYPINYTAFDALNLRKLTTSVGFSLKNRFNFNPLFLELNFQLGIMTKQRTFLNYSNHEAEAFADHKFVVRPYSEIGLKIGYKFPTKTN
jgi:hypothetical protein